MVVERRTAGELLVSEFGKVVPLAAAFWLQDEAAWTLYLVSDHFNSHASNEHYAELTRIVRQINNPELDASDVRLIGVGDEMAQAAIKTYRNRSPSIPISIGKGIFGGREVDGVYLIHGPKRRYEMATGREVLDRIIDEEAEFFRRYKRSPSTVRLPILMAYDLAKCGRDDLGELSGKVFKDGIKAFESDGFHGMKVEIVRDAGATLELL